VQSGPDGCGHGRGVRAVTVQAQTLHAPGSRQAYGLLGRPSWLANQGARLLARHEAAVVPVPPVDEALRDHPQARLPRQLGEHAVDHGKDGEAGVVEDDGVDDRLRLGAVGQSAVVEGAVRLEIAHTGPGHPAQPVEGGQLVQDVGLQVPRRHVHRSPPEPRQVRVGNLRPHRDAPLGRQRDDVAQRGGVAGVEAARAVGAADVRQERGIVAQGPPAVRLTEIGIEVDGGCQAWCSQS